METRKAKITDLDQLAKLFDQYRVFYRKGSNLEAATSFLEERMKNKESEIFVVEENDTLLGFTQLYPLFSSTNMKRLWLLNDLFVVDNARGKGISKMLINAAKKLARDTKAVGVSLETEKSNAIGNFLYPATDFSLDDEHNYYFWAAEW